MELIKSLEIGYFRSIYKHEFKNLSTMNVFFGKNDSGKSNVIRALNLFFNSETNIGRKFDLGTDLCHARLAESKEMTDARKFVYIKLTFNTPASWVKSLGSEFYVKKSWSLTTGEEYNIESSIKENAKQMYLKRFLNSIRFRYIPAIKDRSIFSSLLAELYTVLSSDSEFNKSLDSFSQELQSKTIDLQSDIFNELNYDSRIAPPTDLTTLFRALDFDTHNEAGDRYSLTNQHGDGIQVRHIPSMLAYLSTHNKERYNIWGFEEPENSLELAAAIKESERLLGLSKQGHIQLFITSHSPAFYSLEDTNIRKYYASKINHVGTDRQVTKWDGMNAPSDISRLLGDDHLMVKMAKTTNEYREFEKSTEELRDKIARASKPLLFVEGESDKIIIESILQKLYKEKSPISVVSGGGTTKMKALSQHGIAMQQASNRQIFILLDNDTEGRAYYVERRMGRGGIWCQNNSNKHYFARLPFSAEFESFYNKLRIPEEHWPGTIENYIPVSIRQEAMRIKNYKIANAIYSDFDNDRPSRNTIIDLISNKPKPEEKLYIYPIHFDYKISFSKHIAKLILSKSFKVKELEQLLKEAIALIKTDID